MSDDPQDAQRKLEQFEALARRLLHVPKRDVDEARKAEQSEARDKRRPKTT